MIGFASGVNANGGDEIGNELGNFEADGTRRVSNAMGVAVDGLDVNFVAACGQAASMLVIDGGGNNGRRKSSQGSDLNNAARRKNADKTGKKKIIARANAPGITDVVEIDHPVKELYFTRSRNFAGMTELVGELPILNL